MALVGYRQVGRQNADLPATLHVLGSGALPPWAEQLAGEELSHDEVFTRFQLALAPTEFSATAPLKNAARRTGLRAATMPGLSPAMLPALRLDWEEIDRRCRVLAGRLDLAEAAEIHFEAEGEAHELRLDLRFRTATPSGGLLRTPGIAGNLPSGETYIVPYEGEREGEPSETAGTMPLELDGELLTYRIMGNRVVEVLGDGPRAQAEREELTREPAYGNVAELGLGLLASYGIQPIGELLLDEKLGLHVATGRSDHFGGQVGVKDFSSPENVVHIDRVYIPEVQPQVRVPRVDLVLPGGERAALMRDGRYALDF